MILYEAAVYFPGYGEFLWETLLFENDNRHHAYLTNQQSYYIMRTHDEL